MAKYFTSDTHFGFKRVLEFSQRPFRDMQEHDEVLLDDINRRVGRNDTLYHNGDFAGHNEGSYRQKIRCKDVRLVIGNHDLKRALVHFKHCDYMLWAKICGVPTHLSHYPMAFWDRSHYNSFHLYGHCHLQREQLLDELFPGRRSMECGVDAAFNILGHWGPFSEGEINDILGSRPGFDHVEDYHGTPRDPVAVSNWLNSRSQGS